VERDEIRWIGTFDSCTKVAPIEPAQGVLRKVRLNALYFDYSGLRSPEVD
jgi:hypothetical protein